MNFITKKNLSRGLLLVGITLMSGCTFLPSSGPSGYMIRNNSRGKNYALVPINPNTLELIAKQSDTPSCLSVSGRNSDRFFLDRGIEDLQVDFCSTISAGDLISVAFFETDTALFRPSMAAGTLAASPATMIPPQTVDQTGEISVPFVGRVKAIGRLPVDIENEIKEKLKYKTSAPQVIVSITDRKGGDLISIVGDVRQPAQIPVSIAGTKLIDAIARVGGSLSAPHDVMVTVNRGNTKRSDSLQEIYDKTEKNIQLRPGDTVIVRKRTLTFKAFGSTGRVGSYPIPNEDFTLSDAIASTGGPLDLQANPATIFVYREEPNSFLNKLVKIKISNSSFIPVIYQLNLHDPQGFFYAEKFGVRDRDIIYYAAAGSSGLMKFMGLINTFLAPATGSAGAAASVSILAAP